MGCLDGLKAGEDTTEMDIERCSAVARAEVTGDPHRPLLVVQPQQRERGLVIIFHGAGGSAQCFQDLAEAWGAELPHVKFVLPTAPVRGSMTLWMGRDSKTRHCVNYEGL